MLSLSPLTTSKKIYLFDKMVRQFIRSLCEQLSKATVCKMAKKEKKASEQEKKKLTMIDEKWHQMAEME